MIKIVPDVGAPALVVGVDLLTSEYAPTWNETASYILAGGAYLASVLGLVKGNGGEFVKNMGIAALPLAARNIYGRIKMHVAQRAGASRLALRPVSSSGNTGPISRTYQPEFEHALAI